MRSPDLLGLCVYIENRQTAVCAGDNVAHGSDECGRIAANAQHEIGMTSDQRTVQSWPDRALQVPVLRVPHDAHDAISGTEDWGARIVVVRVTHVHVDGILLG